MNMNVINRQDHRPVPADGVGGGRRPRRSLPGPQGRAGKIILILILI